jgi:hypothetical protein
LRGVRRFREALALRGGLDDLQPVAQPLHHRAGDEDRAFQRIGRFAVELVGDGAEQPVAAFDQRVAGVQKREAPGAVGRFQHAGRETGLPQRRRLLVARHAEDRDGVAEQRGVGGAEIRAGIQHLGQEALGDVQELQDIVVPAPLPDVVEQRARRVGGVGDMALAARQLPDQPAVDGAEGELAGFGPLPRALDVVEEPGELGAREIRVEQKARLLLHHRLMAGLRAAQQSSLAVRRSCQTMALCTGRRCRGPTAPPSRAGW